ncbi:MAG: isocitrate lyase/PEP mutase family protein [Gammaproteobacteria bacterium]|nr:isocitrate lyase/PEP mutase family protein [Gammaproteobacteria bacterium]
MSTDSQPSLKRLIQSGTFIVAPGVYDGFSAKIADRMGFHALYMTGYGMVASRMGIPDAGIATYNDMVEGVRCVAGATRTPVIADADTGYGGLLNVRTTVRGYEAAGAAAIQIEDQDIPKKCGHTPGRRVIPMEDMVMKVKVAVDSRESEETLIIARTDARTALGLDEALRRVEAYAEAGADILFVESPESLAELEKIGASLDAPLLANMVPGGGRTPEVSAEQLQQFGFNVVIYPGVGFCAASHAVGTAFSYLKEHGSVIGLDLPRINVNELHTLMGFEEVWEFERKFGQRE